MEPRSDLRNMSFTRLLGIGRVLPQNATADSFRGGSARRMASSFGIGAAWLVLGLAAASLSAQQYWPPDDPSDVGQNPGVSQPYPPTQQYAYPQAQPPQPAYQQYPQSQYPQPTYQGPPQTYAQQGYGQQLSQAQPLNPDELTQLVAPIALYPDALVAQILAASTYPAQVSAADQWLRSMGNVAPEQVAAGADAQSSWDPSVKALTAFPQVLAMLDRNLQWTTNLGNAYYNQPQDVLQTVQVMRERAEQAGNLQSTPQEQVSDNQGAIDIAPTNPQVVYVPTYNPWAAYGQPVSPYPGFSWLGTIGSLVGSAFVHFGPGIAMNAFMATPYGWLGWGLDWLAHAILFNHGSYFTHSNSVADWGFPHGGPRAYPGVPQFAHSGYGGVHNGYAPGYGRPETNYRAYGQGFSRQSRSLNDARTAEGFNRGYPQRGEVPMRPALPSQEAYNRYPQSFGRSQQFENRQPSYESRQPAYSSRIDQYGRQSYGSAYSNPSRDSYAPQRGMSYGSPSQTYRAPENSYRGNSAGRSYDSFRGGEVAQSQRSGGFHFFGSHNSSEYGGKAPKAYSYGGGRSGGGGWKAPKAPKESHFGGGHSGGGHEHSSHHR
jgi:Protein of unknown function (DUF3300)